jgi:polysaccharide export outer membrane protein
MNRLIVKLSTFGLPRTAGLSPFLIGKFVSRLNAFIQAMSYVNPPPLIGIVARRIGDRVLFVLCMAFLVFHQGAIAQQGSGYILGPGDVVKITVFQNPDMTTEARISEEGKITFPLIGQVEVGGVTPAAAEARIAGRLNAGGFVLNPQVNMVVSQFRSRMVSVLGQVSKSGRYPIEERSATVADMLAMAGGVLPTGGDEVIVIRKKGDSEERLVVDLDAGLLSGGPGPKVELENDDTLYVPRAPMFYIYGEVQKPGQYRLERGITVMQAISAGGGLTLRGTDKRVRISRTEPDGNIKEMDAKLNDPVRKNDVIYVKESLF